MLEINIGFSIWTDPLKLAFYKMFICDYEDCDVIFIRFMEIMIGGQKIPH